jgi:glycosyltransferase involved in cell wall biosynthesis
VSEDDAVSAAGVGSPAAALAGVSAVVPAYDEVESLPEVVAGLLAVLPRVAGAVEVIIVDDGSRDGTGALADRLAATDPRVRTVHHRRNRGYGAAVWSGIRAARLEVVFVTDGDGQFDPDDLVHLAPLARTYDIVAGHRTRRADPFGRRLAGRLWSGLVRRLFGVPLRDVNCAFKLFRRSLFRSMRPESTGALISAELLARALQAGRTIVEVPVTHLPRRHGRATGGTPGVALRALAELLRLRRRIARARGESPAARTAPAGDRASCI